MGRHVLIGERPALKIYAGLCDVPPADPFDPVRDLLDLVECTVTAERIARLAPVDNACRLVAEELEAQLHQRVREMREQLARSPRPGGEGGAA